MVLPGNILPAGAVPAAAHDVGKAFFFATSYVNILKYTYNISLLTADKSSSFDLHARAHMT